MGGSNDALVSVLIPAYNGAAVIAETLQSVQQQTHRNLQIIIVDDGSADDTPQIAAEFARTDERFLVLSQPNGGTQAARNTALRHATGEFIALLDQDDIWMPEKIAAQLALFEGEPRANLVFSNYFDWDGSRHLGMRYPQPHKMPEGDVARQLTAACLFGAATVMVRKTTLDEVGFFDEELVHTGDWDMWLRIAEHGLWCRGVWEPLMRYRVWQGNASGDRLGMAEGSLRVLEKALQRPQSAAMKGWYEAALRHAQANIELSRARRRVDELDAAHERRTSAGTDAGNAGVDTQEARRDIARSVLRAWRYEPRAKYLLWYLACAWPVVCGGRPLAARVYRRLRRRW